MSFIQYENQEGVGIIRLNRGKANAINHDFVIELRQKIESAKQDSQIKSVVIVGKDNFFSAGLDVIELFDYDRKKIKEFWRDFMGLVIDLTAFPKPLISAINGQSPAGGCVIAVCCDYRVMAEGNFKIGLNEIPVGIIVPDTIFYLYEFWIGSKNAYQYLLEGRLLNTAEAANCGLVDEVVPQNEVLETAIKKAKYYSKFGSNTWSKSKMNLRRNLLRKMDVDFDELFKDSLEHWWSNESRTTMSALIDSLTKK